MFPNDSVNVSTKTMESVKTAKQKNLKSYKAAKMNKAIGGKSEGCLNEFLIQKMEVLNLSEIMESAATRRIITQTQIITMLCVSFTRFLFLLFYAFIFVLKGLRAKIVY